MVYPTQTVIQNIFLVYHLKSETKKKCPMISSSYKSETKD